MDRWLVTGSLCLIFAPLASGQTPPPLIPFGGVVVDQTGQPRPGLTSLLLAIYEEPTGGVPAWVEMQTVEVDAAGRYAVVLGAASPDGVPLDLFADGTARWIGVQPEGQAEQPRVVLLSVPYALKAADAETIGGLPVSAFIRADTDDASPVVTTGEAWDTRATASDGRAVTDQTISDDLLVTGTVTSEGHVAFNAPGRRFWYAGGGGVNAVMGYDETGGLVIGPQQTIGSVRLPTGGYLHMDPSGRVGIGTLTPSMPLHVEGALTATTFVGDGSGLTNLPAGGPGTATNVICPVPCIDASEVSGGITGLGANTFTGTQTINFGNLDLDDSTAGAGNITKNGVPILHNFGTSNLFLGEWAGNFNLRGASGNVGIGQSALLNIDTGDANTAVGGSALRNNESGHANTAVGVGAAQRV